MKYMDLIASLIIIAFSVVTIFASFNNNRRLMKDMKVFIILTMLFQIIDQLFKGMEIIW